MAAEMARRYADASRGSSSAVDIRHKPATGVRHPNPAYRRSMTEVAIVDEANEYMKSFVHWLEQAYRSSGCADFCGRGRRFSVRESYCGTRPHEGGRIDCPR
jgi:hypothetical protein